MAAIKSLRFALVIDISMELKAYQLCYKQIEHWKYYIRKWHNYGPALSKSSIDFLIPVRAHNAGTTYYEWELHRKRNQTTAVPCTIKKPPRWWTPHIAAKPIPFMQKNYTVIILWGQHLLFVASTLPKEWWVIITMKCQRSGKIGGALPVKIQNLITNFIPIIWICRMELPTSGITLRSLQNETSLYRKQRRAGFLFKLKHFELESLCEPTRNGLQSAKGQTELKLKKLLFCSQQILQKSFSTVKYFPICHV